MIEVPVKYGWFSYDNPEAEIEWFDNIEHYTAEQCNIMADCCSKERKLVEYVMSDTEFEEEQTKLGQII